MIAKIATVLLCIITPETETVFAPEPTTLATTVTQLKVDHQDTESELAACPDGTCTNASALADRVNQLSSELASAHAERDAIESCECGFLDSLLSEVDVLSDALQATISAWDETA
ncbi:MAG: hypothetical protein AAF533_04660 [Acidobacteriota bacterium]